MDAHENVDNKCIQFAMHIECERHLPNLIITEINDMYENVVEKKDEKPIHWSNQFLMLY